MARAGTILYGLGWWPWIQRLYMKSIPKKSVQEQVQLYIVAVKKLMKRMEAVEERPDFLQGLLEKKEKLVSPPQRNEDNKASHTAQNLKTENLEANSSTLVAAGSETTATALSGLTYHLLKNPDMLARLTDEVRQAFSSDGEIDFSSVGNLPYLKACVDEILRVYPPTPSALPRSVPEGGATVCDEFIPENVSLEYSQTMMI
jgi:cytochrome P450